MNTFALATKISNDHNAVVLSTNKMYKTLRSEGYNKAECLAFRAHCSHVEGYIYDMSPILSKTQNVAIAAVKPKPVEQTPEQTPEPSVPVKKIQSVVNDEIFVPKKNPLFVSWGDYSKIKKIISSKRFFPLFIAGESGTGKTINVKQACSELGRSYCRVQINNETTEDDLIGGFRLIDGDTVFVKGPVLKAMETGSILLLDEIDRGTDLLLCLQGVLEGSEYLVKKTGEIIVPTAGFNVIATANSKGRGDDAGKYSSNILDDAFLERFRILLVQEMPAITIEKKILSAKMKKEDCFDAESLEKLCVWIDSVRKSYKEDVIGSTISSRRSCAIIETFAIFGNMREAVEMCVSRYDAEDVEALLSFYDIAIDSETL